MHLIRYLFLFIVITTSAQSGKYIGLEPSGGTYEPQEGSSDIMVYRENFVEKKLILNSDSTFYFEFEWPMLTAQIPLYRCGGKWKKINDTIVLNSCYKASDFFNVSENHIQTSPADLIILVFKSNKGYFNAQLSINRKEAGSYHDNDTLYYKCAAVQSILLTLSWPGSMELRYTPLKKTSNNFIFTVIPEIDNNNLIFENAKLILRDHELKPLTKNSPLSVEKNYKPAK